MSNAETRNVHVAMIARGDVAYALDLANLLHNSGLSVNLYLSYDHVIDELGPCDYPIERLYHVGLLPPECKVQLFRPPKMRNPFSILTYSALSRIIQAENVDIVHILAGPHELWLAILSWLLRTIPVVSTMIVPKPNPGGRIPLFLNRTVNQLLASGSDMVIVNGEEQVIFVRDQYRVPFEKLSYVPLNARTTAIQWSMKRVRAEEPGTILFFGAARLHKGLEYLIRAQPIISRQAPDARVLISSYGSELVRCRKLIVDSTKFEIHEGYISGEGMAALFQRASLVALPYLSASTSGVLLTAYSFGKPVVATRVGCLPEYVVEKQTGLLVEPRDEQQLADAIIQLLNDDATRIRMGENAFLWVKAREETIAMKTISAYEAALAHHVAS